MDICELCDKYIRVSSEARGFEKDGREVFSATCTLCRCLLKNSRSAKRHLRTMHANLLREENQTSLDCFFGVENAQNDQPRENEDVEEEVLVSAPSSVLDDYTRLQIRLICRVGLPLATLRSRHWKALMQFLGSDVKVSPSRLRASLLLYSDEIKARNYAQVKGQLVSIITDGGTITDKEFYIVVLFCNGQFYFAGALHLTHTGHDSIAEALSPIIDTIRSHQGKPISIVTDNARNLKLATTDAEQPGRTIDTSSQISSIQSRTGQPMLHISCTVHSAHLILRDLEKERPDFATFKKGIKNLFAYLRERKTRTALREIGVTEKVKLIQDIKWLTYYQAFSFIERHRDQVNELLSRNSTRSCRKSPPFREIPEEWYQYLKSLAPLGEFIVETERSRTRLCEVFDLLLELKKKWAAIGNPVSERLAEMLSIRFDRTANGLLTQLAYLFTPKGLVYFRSIFCALDREDTLDQRDYERRLNLRDALMREFTTVYGYFGFVMAEVRVPPLFHQFVRHYQPTSEPMNVQLCRLRTQTLEMQGVQIPWNDFCLVVERLLELPASESVAERMISHMAALFPASRFSAKPELVDAQITVRAQEVFDEYNANAGLTSTI